MAQLNFALDPKDYTLSNALLWGNFRGHCIKVTEGKWGHRIVHLCIAIVLFPPIVSQIASLFEMVIVRSVLFRVRKAHRHKVLKVVKEQIDQKQKGEDSPPKSTENSQDILSKSLEDELSPGEPPIILPNITPTDLTNKKGSGTPSPSGSDLSDAPSTDSETPVSITETASMQLERARLEKQESNCTVV